VKVVTTPQQHRRTGPTRHQAGKQANVQLQIIHGAGSVLGGIELMHMIRKGQFAIDGADAMSFADHFLHWQEWFVRYKRRSALPGKFRR